MAQVDFSNAVIDVIGSHKPLPEQYLALSNYNSPTAITSFLTLSDPWISLAHPTVNILLNTTTKYSVHYTGTFESGTPSGSTEFGIYIRQAQGSLTYDFYWKVTNVLFNAGDTFSFAVDVEITGD